MTVQIWKGSLPEYDSETRAILKLAEDLGRLKGLYLVVANIYVPPANIDLIVIKNNGLFIVELKQCAQKIVGGTNGEWRRVDEKGNSHSFYQGSSEGMNAYQQVCGYYFNLKGALGKVKTKFLSHQKARSVRFDGTKSVIAVSPFLDPTSEIDVDWKVNVLGLDELARFIFSATSGSPDTNTAITARGNRA